MRLEKYIATSGIASRRSVKKSIQAGRVTVNGEPVLVPGHPINVETDAVEFEGKRVEPLTERLYLMLNKPAGYVTTRHDERGRPTVMDLVADLTDTIYPVGRWIWRPRDFSFSQTMAILRISCYIRAMR